MPKDVERALWKAAIKKFPKNKKKQRAYVYGRLRKMGWKPDKEKGK